MILPVQELQVPPRYLILILSEACRTCFIEMSSRGVIIDRVHLALGRSEMSPTTRKSYSSQVACCAAVAGLGLNPPPFVRSAQVILAILLASALAATLAVRRASRPVNQGEVAPPRVRADTAVAPTTSEERNTGSPMYRFSPTAPCRPSNAFSASSRSTQKKMSAGGKRLGVGHQKRQSLRR